MTIGAVLINFFCTASQLRTAFASTVALVALGAIAYAQFLSGCFLYGRGTQRGMAFLNEGQPVPGSVIDSNIFWGIIVPNMLAFCLYLAVFLLWSVALRRRPLRIYVVLGVAVGVTFLIFLIYMAAGIATYGS